MWIRALGDTLTDVAGSLLSLGADSRGVTRTTSVELTLPIEVKMRCSADGLILCADVPAWRWRTYWDPPFGQLRLTLEEARQEIVK